MGADRRGPHDLHERPAEQYEALLGDARPELGERLVLLTVDVLREQRLETGGIVDERLFDAAVEVEQVVDERVEVGEVAPELAVEQLVLRHEVRLDLPL